jgi:archaellum component FlaC
VGNADKKLSEISEELDRLANSANDLVVRVNTIVGRVDSMTAPDSPERYQLKRMLQEVSGAARSLRILADSISAQPDILIKGKPVEK